MHDRPFFDRRQFLTRSALVAAAVGLIGVQAAAAQSAPPQESKPAPSEEPKPEAPKTPEGSGDKKKPLIDKNGREYRVCDMCGSNMYVEEKRWTCEQCGFSYEV